MSFLSRVALHTTSDTWVGAGQTSSSASPVIQSINLADSQRAVIAATVTVNTYSAGTFTAATSDVCTKTAHGFVTGLKVQVSNSGGALPTGLTAVTDYFVIRIDADTFYLATSLANALAGTRIDITGTGSGTQTITPQALAGATVKLQGSLDNGTTWFDVPNESRVITATGAQVWEIESILFPDYRLYPTVTAGSITVSATGLGRRN